MYKFIKYIEFLLRSTNQHGVHSPFVYNYITKCLYSKPKQGSSKVGHVLLNSIGYFKVRNIGFFSLEEPLLEKVNAEHTGINLDKKPYDLVFVDAPEAFQVITDLISNVHNDTLIIVNAIYKTKANTTNWEKIKNSEWVTVSMDMYHYGAVFFRKEQATEHFTVRI